MNYKRGPGNYKSSYLVTVLKKADQIINDENTPTNDTELFVPLKPNRSYCFQLQFFASVKPASDFRFGFTIPSGASGVKGNEFSHPPDDQTTEDIVDIQNVTCSDITAFWVISGTVTTGSTAGNLQFTWAQSTSVVEDTKVLKGSMLMVVTG